LEILLELKLKKIVVGVEVGESVDGDNVVGDFVGVEVGKIVVGVEVGESVDGVV
jgi:hypothetical protein